MLVGGANEPPFTTNYLLWFLRSRLEVTGAKSKRQQPSVIQARLGRHGVLTVAKGPSDEIFAPFPLGLGVDSGSDYVLLPGL